jgi:hypothetical protein
MAPLVLNLAAACWLFVSAFVLPYSTVTAWNALVVAVVVVGIAFLSFAAIGRPGIRWVIAVLAVWLVVGTMLMPHQSLATVFNDVVVAMVLGLVSFVPTPRWAPRGEVRPGAALR